MSSSIPAPNYTQIPNVIFDYWMFHLSPAEFKVLMCICRKTFGWHKTLDKISLKQIQEITGLSRKGITDNLNRLLDLNIIIKEEYKLYNGGNDANKYGINVTCMVTPSELITPPTSELSTPPTSELSTPTKESISFANPISKKSIDEIKEKKTHTQKKEKSVCVFFGSHVKLCKEEYETLCTQHSKTAINDLIREMNDYCSAHGKNYKDYAAALRQWRERKLQNAVKSVVDRRTRKMDGTPVSSPADRLF